MEFVQGTMEFAQGTMEFVQKTMEFVQETMEFARAKLAVEQAIKRESDLTGFPVKISQKQ